MSWIFGGMLIGLIVGVLAGLLRRRPTRFDHPTYAGGYDPPRPSSDHTAMIPPSTANGGNTDRTTDGATDRTTDRTTGRAPIG